MGRQFLISTCLLVFAIAPLTANTPELSREDNEKALQLLRKLGAKDFKIRESAGTQLVRMGRAVEPILRAGLANSDPEIRFRSRYLLPLAMNYDLEKRIQAFLADTGGKADLPGWARWWTG